MVQKKTDRISMREKRGQILRQMESFGGRIYDQIVSGEFPWIKMPSRSTRNILFDSKTRQFVLGEKSVRRSSRNIRHLKPFAQLLWVASFAKELMRENRTSTLRDVFYQAQAFDMTFQDQAESDDIITDLETVLEYAREDFSIFPEERSAIFGDLTVEYTVPGYEGKQLNLTSAPDGMMIGPALTSSEFVDTSAERVIVIEKGAMFTRFIEEKAYRRFKALLIHTAGQAPRGTRQIIRRLNRELNLPLFLLTDADPWAMHIAAVIVSGSANAAHLRELTTPDAKWIGVWATDIIKYRLPHERLSELDIKRLHELKKDIRYKEPLWQREIDSFLDNKMKAEQEAFSRYGLSFIVDKYLPEKLREAGD